MTWFKVCGLTNRDDTLAAAEAGADALGFVIVSTSPRAITLDRAAELMRDHEQATFLLTHDLEPEALVSAALSTGASGVQPYGRFAGEAAAAAAEVGLMVLRPVGYDDEWRDIPLEQVPLFDAKTPNGTVTGRTLQTESLPRTDRSFVVAGGLTADNVGTVIQSIHPFGVDVSSGVEVRPGRKDHSLLNAFARAVKATG